MVMNFLACVAGSFLRETFINIYTALQGQTKKNDAFSPRPSPASPPIVFWFNLSSAFVQFISLFTNHKRKNKQTKKHHLCRL